MHEGRKQTNTWSAYAGSRLELSDALGRRRPKRHPSSRIGENPPYGMTGGIEETSASFEARSAPRSYPTYGNWDDGCGQTTLVPRCNATVPASSKSAISAGTCCPKSPPITRGPRVRIHLPPAASHTNPIIASSAWFPVSYRVVRRSRRPRQKQFQQKTRRHLKILRERLFGSWEMNWVGFNYARDFTLPGQQAGPIGFLMYPYAETAQGVKDSLDSDAFSYTITSKELG